MTGQQHTIKKFSFELQMQESMNSYALQRSCVTTLKENLVYSIDEILSAHFTGTEIVKIKKIEIDLGTITPGELEQQLFEKCRAALYSQLKTISATRQQEQAIEVTTTAAEDNYIEQFFYFLSSGKMHWAATGINFKNWQKKVTTAMQSRYSFFKQQCRDFFTSHPAATGLLVTQFEDDFIQNLLLLYYPHSKNEYGQLLIFLQDNFSTTTYWRARQISLLQLFNFLFRKTTTNSIADVKQSIQTALGKPVSPGEKIIDQLTAAIITVAEKSAVPVESKMEDSYPGDAASVDNAEQEHETTAEKETLPEEKFTYISNAGLVILHPFLQHLFTNTGLLQQDNFKDEESRHKAVQLLQYLATGEVEVPEYLLPLNKLLCGYTGDTPVDRLIPLDASWKKEADELLQAVITHWSGLKNTSVAAMQETFFERRGKLSFVETDGYWKLQVERKAVDILLDKIPWGISYVQLPWMPQALITEW